MVEEGPFDWWKTCSQPESACTPSEQPSGKFVILFSFILMRGRPTHPLTYFMVDFKIWHVQLYSLFRDRRWSLLKAQKQNTCSGRAQSVPKCCLLCGCGVKYLAGPGCTAVMQLSCAWPYGQHKWWWSLQASQCSRAFFQVRSQDQGWLVLFLKLWRRTSYFRFFKKVRSFESSSPFMNLPPTQPPHSEACNNSFVKKVRCNSLIEALVIWPLFYYD